MLDAEKIMCKNYNELVVRPIKQFNQRIKYEMSKFPDLDELDLTEEIEAKIDTHELEAIITQSAL